jgi:hypothetical protein
MGTEERYFRRFLGAWRERGHCHRRVTLLHKSSRHPLAPKLSFHLMIIDELLLHSSNDIEDLKKVTLSISMLVRHR